MVSSSESAQSQTKVPASSSKKLEHIAVVMDGNQRWAVANNKSVSEGHRRGAETLKNVIRGAAELGVKYLTVYAFSTENWDRPDDEVSGLMEILQYHLLNSVDEINENGVRLKFIGDRSKLDPELLPLLDEALRQTKDNKTITLVIAFNYGGRSEIVRAVKKLAKEVLADKVSPEDVTEAFFEEYLDTRGIPDPDIFIRPAGEKRISNFLLWQSAYTEFIFTDVMWPDFSKEHLQKAIQEFGERNRRYGSR